MWLSRAHLSCHQQSMMDRSRHNTHTQNQTAKTTPHRRTGVHVHATFIHYIQPDTGYKQARSCITTATHSQTPAHCARQQTGEDPTPAWVLRQIPSGSRPKLLFLCCVTRQGVHVVVCIWESSPHSLAEASQRLQHFRTQDGDPLHGGKGPVSQGGPYHTVGTGWKRTMRELKIGEEKNTPD